MVEALDYLPADALETLVKAGKAERLNRPTETLAEALLWVSFVAHKLTHNGQVPATWGTLYVAEQVSLRWGQLVQSKDPRTPTQRLNEELRAVVIDYYRNRPGRLANLSAPGPKGTPFEGPALAVTALNAAIAVNRAAKPTVAWTTQRPYEGDFWTKAADVVSGEGNSESTWKRQDRQPWDAGEEIAREDALGVEEQLFGREDELPTTRERLTEVGVPEQDVETLLAWMLAYKATKDGQPIGVDWSFLRRRFDVGSIAVAQKKVRRARKRFVGLVRARLAPDDPAQRELDACVRDVQGRLAEPAKRPVPTVREVLLSYGVDLTAKPNKLGWVEVTCPWHESDRTRKGGAGWHPALNLYKCWHVDCLLPAGGALTAERLAFYLADEAA
jgi:hypothetical protein